MTVTADIPFTPMVQYHRLLASIIVGTYYALVSVVCINLYIALMSETFTRVYEKAEANASLQQALLIIFMERQMGPSESAKMRKHFAKKCSPLVSIASKKSKLGIVYCASVHNSLTLSIHDQFHSCLKVICSP